MAYFLIHLPFGWTGSPFVPRYDFIKRACRSPPGSLVVFFGARQFSGDRTQLA
jgi:hypothetical protein